jgi:hypothetical protein
MIEDEFNKLVNNIINCNRCPELISYIRSVALKKKNNTKIGIIGENLFHLMEI